MSVFLIADIKVTNDSWVPEYAAEVHKLVEMHGGKYLSRSGNIETLEGADKESTLIALLEFPSRAALDRVCPGSGLCALRSGPSGGKRQQFPSDRRHRTLPGSFLIWQRVDRGS